MDRFEGIKILDNVNPNLFAAGLASAPGAFSELRNEATSQHLGCHGFLICGFRAYLFPARQHLPSREPNHLPG
jgi:hypothetical protein